MSCDIIIYDSVVGSYKQYDVIRIDKQSDKDLIDINNLILSLYRRVELDELLTDFPNTPVLERCEPVFEYMPGWKCDIGGIKNYEDLPAECKAYIERIEREIGVKITMVSNGPAREDIIFL